MRITDYQECQCGAISLYFENGDCNSIRKENMDKFGISLNGASPMQNSYCCNHCVNHYGLDICSCGSGELTGECECGSTEARENYGESVPFIPLFR